MLATNEGVTQAPQTLQVCLLHQAMAAFLETTNSILLRKTENYLTSNPSAFCDLCNQCDYLQQQGHHNEDHHR